MHILILNYEFPPLGGGAAPVSKDIAIELVKRGHDVTVLTMGYRSLPEYEEIGGVKVYRLPCIRHSKSSCNPIEQYSYLRAVDKFMKRTGGGSTYDICHAHFVIPTGQAAFKIKKRYNIPYVVTAHGSDVEGHNTKILMRVMHRFLRPFWRRIVRESQCVVSPSQYLMDRMYGNFSIDKYRFIPNGIDYELFHSHDCIVKKSILIMGRLQKFKNVQFILEALNSVDMDGWELNILGDGPYAEDILQKILESKWHDRIHYRGWIDNKSEEQLKFIYESSIYISASQFENCPMSVIEAIGAGCYPLVSDIPAHRQLLSDDRFFFDLENVESLSEKLQGVIKAYNENVDVDIPDVSRYSWGNVIKEYLQVFDGIQKNVNGNGFGL